MASEYTPTEMMDRGSRSNRYYRNAVERHWDPGEIDLSADAENLLEFAATTDGFDRMALDGMINGIAKFGAGEDAVTEDLAPMATVLEDELGWDRSNPRDEKWFNDPYTELFDRNRRAQYRLLEEGTLASYAVEKHTDRMQQITDAAADIPDVDELVQLEGDD